MRVLHVYKTFLPETLGGLEQAIFQIVRSTASRDCQVRVLSLGPQTLPPREICPFAEHWRYRRTMSFASNDISLSLLGHFGRHVDWASVIHYHFPWPFADALHLLWRVRKPAMATYHSDIVRQQALLRLYRPLMSRFLRRVDRIVATSPNYLASSPVLKEFADKAAVIPIGLDARTYPELEPQRVEHWRAVLGEDFFLFVGVLRYYKGLHILLDACKGFGGRVVIVGAGPIESELRARARAEDLHNVCFLGFVPEEDKMALLHLCRGVVFPSHLRSEAFGVSLLEGAMRGRPMISSEIGTGTSFVNIHGETGLVVPAGDASAFRRAMETLLNDANLAATMGQRARQRFLAHFQAEDAGRAYLAEYERLTSSSNEATGNGIAVRGRYTAGPAK